MYILSNSLLDLLPLGTPNNLLETSNNWNVNKLFWAVVLHREYGHYKWSTVCQLAQGVKLSCDDVNIICLALFDHLRSISALKKYCLFLCHSTSLIFHPYLTFTSTCRLQPECSRCSGVPLSLCKHICVEPWVLSLDANHSLWLPDWSVMFLLVVLNPLFDRTIQKAHVNKRIQFTDINDIYFKW